ncbi:MAG: alpha/beta hydrolase [Desulfobacterales bacterium]|jgi:pimeloyl-ACP methyl ester carboxylesterase
MEAKTVDGIHFIAGRWPLSSQLPTLLFIHGSGGACTLWKDQVQALSFLINTIAIDLPGHGASEGPGRKSVKAYAEAVFHFIEAMDIQRPVPCGLSLGGAIVQRLLLDYSGPFLAGILISTGARLKVLPALFDAIESDYEGFIGLFAEMGFSVQTDASMRHDALAAIAHCDPGVTAGDFTACNRFDVMERVKEIDLPVLVVSATEDRLTPPKYSDYLFKQIPRSVRVRVKGSGHMVPVEKPAAVTAAIVDFLDRIPSTF